MSRVAVGDWEETVAVSVGLLVSMALGLMERMRDVPVWLAKLIDIVTVSPSARTALMEAEFEVVVGYV